MIKRLAALVLLAALALMVVGEDADARKKKRRRGDHVVGVSNVTIDFEDREPFIPLLPVIFEDPDDYFHGKITPVRGCDGRHTVQVQRTRGGVIGTTEVSSDGTWIVFAEDVTEADVETFFAKAAGVTARGGKACSRGTSPTITVEEEASDV